MAADVKYHVNPKLGPRRCTAKGTCPYGADAPHYSSLQEAREAYALDLARRQTSLTSLKKAKKAPPKRSVAPTSVETLRERVGSMPWEDLAHLAATSQEAHYSIGTILQERQRGAEDYRTALKRFHPSGDAPLSSTGYALLKSDYDRYQADTAELAQAYMDSPFFSQSLDDAREPSPL